MRQQTLVMWIPTAQREGFCMMGLKLRRPIWGGSETKLWLLQMLIKSKWRRLQSNPAEPNESLKLELPGTWEPTCSWCTLSSCVGKRSQGSVLDGNKKNSGRNAVDTGRLTLPMYASNTKYKKERWSGTNVERGGGSSYTNLLTKSCGCPHL